MIDQCYKEFALPKSEYDPDYDVTIRISTAGMPKTQKVKKSMDDETAAEVRASNEKVRADRQTQVDAIADKVAKFKRDFLGAPIRKAFRASCEKKDFQPMEIPYRADEKYWVLCPTAGEV